VQRLSSRGRRSTLHSIERRAPTPESGNAVEEELEAELKPVLSVGLAVFVEPHEREHEMRELELEGLCRLRAEPSRAKAPQHEIADPALRLALPSAPRQERRRRRMLVHEAAEGLRDSA
jgi:hypothetical protein